MMSRAGMHATLAQNAQELSPWLLVAAAGFVALLALLVASPRLRKRPPAQTPADPQPSADGRAAQGGASGNGVDRDVRELMRELSEMTRRSTAQFDARAERLQQLIRAADERLVKLTHAMTATPASPPHSVAERDPDGDRAAQSTSIQLIEASAPNALPSAATDAPDDGADPRHVEIYTLCEQGLSIPQIADRLRRPSGEIELIIALRPRANRAAVADT